MSPIVSIFNLRKTYSGGFEALKDVSLDIEQGEILALLGPNGAGKTTLISIVCGIVNASSGSVIVDGFDNVREFRQSRERIGLVPQELTLGAFETVWDTLCFSRGLFGKKHDADCLEKVLKDLSLWDKKDEMIMSLSGGMKRRVLIAKALVHEPTVLFLDEPTAGVDVELRKDMWSLVEKLRQSGVTIILTTHYIEEAEAIADRVGVINRGELLLLDEKSALMSKLGKRQLVIELDSVLEAVPASMQRFDLEVSEAGDSLTYTYDPLTTKNGIDEMLQVVHEENLGIRDIHSLKTSLEEIFVNLVKADHKGDGQGDDKGKT